MKRQFGFVASLLVMCATTLMWTGCSSSDGYTNIAEQHYGMECPSPCPPADCPAVCPDPCCEPLCKPAPQCRYPNTNELDCVDGITVTASNPEMCMLGDQYPIEFEVCACKDVCDVEVSVHLPDGVTYERSHPSADVDGKELTFHFGSMRAGEVRHAKVWVECQCEGELCACFCAKATPVRFCAILCAKPWLVCQKCGPEEVCPGDPINYTITVTNRGSCAAEDVVVRDTLPEGVLHASGQSTLTYRLGSLAPCESKTVNICAQACARGEVCNTAVVTSSNADSVSCQACTCICVCDVELIKDGPQQMQIGESADYTVTVRNTGDKPLTDVVVTDCAPSGTSIVAAEGARVNGNQAVWRLRSLDVNESVTFNITLTTCTAGCFTNRASVKTCQGCCDSDEIGTRWRGSAALNVCIVDSEDPICVGDFTTYTITIVNQGSEQDDNVRVVVRFPSEIVPVSVSGDSPGSISNGTVTFEPYDNFSPRQTLKYRIRARANRPGDARIMTEVSSDTFGSPITQQESTIVN